MGARDKYYPIAITFLVVDGLAVGLRFWARGTNKAIGYDDVTMAVSFIGFIIFCTMELEAVNYGIGATVMEPGFDMLKAAMYFTVAQIVYILTTGISKLGVALVLFRLADRSDLRAARLLLLITIAIICIVSLVSALIYALQCRPLSVAWGVGTGTCMSATTLANTGIVLSVVDMTMSWFYALLPIHMLSKAQLPTKLKVSVLLLLGLGGVSSIATIIRLKYVIEVTQIQSNGGGLASESIIETTLQATLYSISEIGLSIFAASLTALRPLLKKVPCFSDISTGGRSGSKPFGSRSAFGNSGRDKGSAYRLDDMNVPDDDSQKDIVPKASRNNIQKQTRIEFSYANEDSKKVDQGGDREQW